MAANPVRRVLCSAAAALVAGLPMACSAPSSAAKALAKTDGLLSWISTHRDHVGLVVLAGEATTPVISLNPDGLFPLASTKKVLILGAYAQAVADAKLAPNELIPTADIERWYWPGTDGGAHLNSLADWRNRGEIRGAAVTLAQVAEAMIRWSDNAAADYLLTRVGGPRGVARFATAMGMSHQQPVPSLYGELAAWATQPEEWLSASPERRVALAQSSAAAEPSPAGLFLPSVPRQRVLSQTDCAGTPAEWAGLMRRLATGSGLPAVATRIIRSALGWPLQAFPGNRASFFDYETKGGSLPGVITEASYLQPLGAAHGTTIAIFFRDLPADVNQALLRSYVHQQFERQLATDPTFLGRSQDRIN